MVYLHLSVLSIKEAVEFYSRKLGLFNYMTSERLICSAGVDLIVDLRESGTERHRETYGHSEQLRSSFWIHVGGEDRSKFPIFSRLKEMNIEYDEVHNLGGHYLYFIDPSKNRFMLHANSGCFE